MPVYRYQALNETGSPVSDVINAPDEATARARVREQGFFPTSLELKEDAGERFFGGGGISDRELAGTTRLLGTLLEAGFPVVEALGTLVNQSAHPRMSRVLDDVRSRVEEGGRLSHALEAHTDMFPDLYTKMVSAGEQGAALPEVLVELATYLEVRSKVKDKFQAALAYPLIMTVVGAVMLCFLVAWVVPTMAELLESSGKELPLITKVLIFSGRVLLDGWWALPFLALGAATAFRMWRSTDAGRDQWDRMRLKVPGLGPLQQKMAMSRFSRLLSVLLKAGVGVLEALNIVKDVVDNIHIERAVEQARAEVAKGASLAEPLKRSGVFPPLVVDMIGAGQRAGKLTETLDRLSEGYETEIEASIETFMALLEPILIIVMAVAVAFVVAGVLLPIFEMNNLQAF